MTDLKVHSNEAEVGLAREIEQKTIEVAAMYRRRYHKKLIPDGDMTKALVLFRTMRMRHAKGDYRHTNSEKQAVKAVAQWSLDVDRLIRNQSRMKLQWAD